MVEIRFITCGDPHIYSGSATIGRLQNVVKFANDAFGKGKLDFIVFLGDLADTVDDNTTKEPLAASIINGLTSNLLRYKVAGNHDVIGSQCIQNCSSIGSIVDTSCQFHTYQGVWPEQLYTFVKSGRTYNIIIPGICAANWSVNPTWYFNYNNSAINKTLPTLVFNHGPVRGSFDTFYGYAFSMASQLTSFANLIGVYAGHVHQATNQLVGKTRYVTDDALPDTTNVGYTRVNDDNSTDYTTLNSSSGVFTDPFPPSPIPTPILTTISTSPPIATINVGATQQLTATCRDQNGNVMACPVLTWASSDTTVATINSSGLVTGIIAGTTNITAKSVSGITSNLSVITVGTTPPTGKKFNIYDVILGGTTKGVTILRDDINGRYSQDQACTRTCVKLGQT